MTIQQQTIKEKQAAILRELLIAIASDLELSPNRDEHGVWAEILVTPEDVAALDAGAAALSRQREEDDEVCTDGYCSICGAIALFGSDRCEKHPLPSPVVEQARNACGETPIETAIADIWAAEAQRGIEQWHLDRLIEAVQQAALVPQGWREIATAPKDGSDVLTFGMAGLVVARWEDEAWRVYNYGYEEATVRKFPTHWMPLPTPPLSPDPPQETR